MEQQEHNGKRHKPAKNHPWRTAVTPKVAKWAKEKAEITPVNDFKRGGGYEPWNK